MKICCITQSYYVSFGGSVSFLSLVRAVSLLRKIEKKQVYIYHLCEPLNLTLMLSKCLLSRKFLPVSQFTRFTTHSAIINNGINAFECFIICHIDSKDFCTT